jgi:RHS repeat-associated protein
MKNTSLRARTLACALLASTAYCGMSAQPAHAQAARSHRAPDANGVDLTWGDYLMRFKEASIGSGDAELALVRTGVWAASTSSNGHEWDGLSFAQSASGGSVTNNVYLSDGISETFANTASLATGSTLDGSGSSYTYTARDGTTVGFSDPSGSSNSASNLCNGSGQANCSLLPTAVTSPDGRSIGIGYAVSEHCTVNVNNPDGVDCTYYARIYEISNSYGYRIAFSYATNSTGAGGIPTSAWFQRSGAAFYNDNVSTTTAQASVSYAYPATGVTEVTNPAGEVWRFTGNSGGVTAIRRPGASSDTTTVSMSGAQVSSVTNEGVTTGYSRSVSGSTATMTVTDALSHVTTMVSDLTKGRPTSVTDALSHTTSYAWDTDGRLTQVTQPEGNYVAYAYDSRGNVTQTQIVPKSGSGLSTLTLSASYDSTCSNPVTCNQPNSVTDARGNTTDFSYDGTHGGVLTVTAPAPTSGATRPETRYSYTLASGEYRLTAVSQCLTGSSCAGTADEAKTTIAYNADGTVSSASSGDGTGALTATTAMTYDAVGNLLTVDGPLSGSADTTRYRYDAARRLVGTVSPDPDGSGSLKPRAVRSTYTNGLVTKVEQGNVDSQSDSDWAAFSTAQEVQTGYDSNARATASKLVSGSTVYALTQASYDALGRPDCVAQRMNPVLFSSITTGACSLGTQGTGSNDYGPDRIVRTHYDAAGRADKATSGYGTADAADDVTLTYTANGAAQTATDAETNKTSYVYDGFDRLSQTLYPSATKGAGTSNSSDYEQSTYDANGNVTAFRNRANETTSFTWDALDRLTFKDRPGTEPDATFTYDLLGRMTGASQSGYALTFGYDALSRLTSQTGPRGSYGLERDVAGRLTRVTWPDAFYVTYDYLTTGEVSQVRETPAGTGLVLASLGYDNAGRRTSLAFGNGGTVSYGYDSVGRLTSETDDLAGTTYDLTLGFSYNPAGQIVQTTRSNDLYSWTGHGNGSLSYGSNGLNQMTSVGSTSLVHDARGNMTFDGSKTFGYDSLNQLTVPATGLTLRYDPLGRLYELDSGANPSRYYDAVEGNELTHMSSAGAIQRRHVFLPGETAPIVWYEGSNTAARRFLHADERGSITTMVTQAGTPLYAPTSYDEYGRMGGASGFFGYTGQETFSFATFYKSRYYAPQLGRFLSPDPIGYEGAMNLYGYVGGDPVNWTDPLGLRRKKLPCPQGPGIIVCGELPHTPGAGGSGGGSAGAGGVAGNDIGGATGTPEDYPCASDACTPIFVTYFKTNDKWVLVDGRFVRNPHRHEPWWGRGFEIGTGLLFEGPVIIISGVEAAGLVGVGGRALAQRMVLSDRWGVFSDEFGTTFFRGRLGSGSANYGPTRLGWSFRQSSGELIFQGRIINLHIPSPIITPGP